MGWFKNNVGMGWFKNNNVGMGGLMLGWGGLRTMLGWGGLRTTMLGWEG